MQKESLAWLILRTIGLLFLCSCAFKMYYFLVNVIFIMAYEPPPALPEETLHLLNLDSNPLFESALLFAIAIYFLRFGKLVR